MTKKLYISLLAVLFLTVLTAFAAVNFGINKTDICADAHSDASLSAVSSLDESASFAAPSSQSRAQVDLIYNSKSFRYNDDFIEPTNHLVAETIFSRKINAPLDEKLRMVDKCLFAGAAYKDAMLYSFPLLKNTVNSAVSYVNCDPVDSEIKFYPDRKPMFTISQEKVGFELVEEKLYQDIYINLRRNPHCRVALTPKINRPKVASSDNVKLTNLRSKFSTEYAQSNENRKHNIRLALSKINGKVILPGEEFSFNKIVGRRSAATGFKEAKIILQGEYVEGFGGGVCQASTTVYNAALRADMKITRARNHSLTSSYVAPSFDAMVNSDSSDLKFVNSSEGAIFIRACGNDSYAEVEIYGLTMPYRISTESVTVYKEQPPADNEIIDTEYKYLSPDAPAGTKMRVSYGHGALKSEGYLLYYNLKGKLIERKLIRKDTYKSIAGVIAVSPKPIPPPLSPQSQDNIMNNY